MLGRIIEASVRNRFLVLLATVFLVAWGAYALLNTPVDAIPDLSATCRSSSTPSTRAVAAHRRGPGHLSAHHRARLGARARRSCAATRSSATRSSTSSSRTAPISTGRAAACSSTSNYAQKRLPRERRPHARARTRPAWAGCSSTRVTSDKRSLAELRSLQDWYLRYQLASRPGVAEVASVGGFVKQYQVTVDPTSCSPTTSPSREVEMARQAVEQRRRRRGHRARRDGVHGPRPRLHQVRRGHQSHRGRASTSETGTPVSMARRRRTWRSGR